MKRRFLTLGLACASMGLLGPGLKAQDFQLLTKIPFSFTVHNKTCPAGVYDFRAYYATADFDALHNQNGKCSLFVGGRRFLTEQPGRARFVFRRYGQNYFLTKIWDGHGTGSSIPKGTREKQLEEATPPTEVATITLNGVNGQ